MRKTSVALLCVASVVMAACGSKKTAENNENVVSEAVAETVAEATEFNGEHNTPEAVDYYGKEMNLNYEALASDISLKGEVTYVYGTTRALTVVKKYGHELSDDEKSALLEQVYTYTQAEADDNVCVWGFYEKKTKEEAWGEKTLADVIANGKKKYDMYSWDYAVEGHLYTIEIEIEDDKATIQGLNGLQKSQDEIWDDAEEALKDKKVQEAVKNALQD